MDISERITATEAFKRIWFNQYQETIVDPHILAAYRINQGYIIVANPYEHKERCDLFLMDELLVTFIRVPFTFGNVKELEWIAKSFGAMLLPLE